MAMLYARCVSSKTRILAVLFTLVLLLSTTAAFADGHTLSGTVYGNGTPLPDTLVEALGDGTTNVAASTTTDGSGHYSLSLADSTTYDLRVTPAAGSGFGEETVQNIVMGTADRTYDVILLAAGPGGGGTVSGSVRGFGGNPLPNVGVTAYDTGNGTWLGNSSTDASGHYSIVVGSSNVRLYLYNNWFATSFAPNYWEGQRYNVAVSGPTTVDIDLPLSQVTGFVHGSDDAALANASVSSNSSMYDGTFYFYGSSWTSTAADGSYSILSMNGSGSFGASPPNDGYWPVSESFTFSGDTTHDFTLPVRENSTISGTIRGAGDNPLPNVSVTAYSQTTGQWLGATQTDGNGFYSLTAANGTVRLYLYNNWYATPYAPNYWEGQRYNIEVSGPVTVDLTLPLSHITGVVRGSDATLLGGASVSANSSIYDGTSYWYGNSYGSAAADGTYSMQVMNGSGSISAGPPNNDYWPVNESYTFSGDATHDFELPVRQNSTVSGTIRGAGNTPIPNVGVTAYSQTTGQWLGNAQTDANGFYSLSAANGQIRLYFYNNWYTTPGAPNYWEAQRYSIDVAGPTTVDLDLPIATVTGIATDSNGSGVANVSIGNNSSVYDGQAGSYFYGQSWTSTAADGTYSMVVFRATGNFGITPPQQSGFLPANLNNVTVTGDFTQRIILQHPDLVAPQIVAGPVVVHLSATSVSISWTTNEASNSRVQFGIGGLTQTVSDSAMVTKHEITLQNLQLASLYQFRVGSTDAAGNGPTYSAQDTFSTQAIADSTPPVITEGPTVTAVDQTSAIIQWSTDEPATSGLVYGLDSSLGTSLDGPANRFTVSHSLRITGLTAQTTYFVAVTGADPDGNASSSSIFSFTTLAVPDTFPPIITSGPTVTSKTDTQMTIAWTTDEPSTSGVSYNDGTRYDLVNDPALTRNHVITISGLTPSTAYFFRVSSTDANGNGPTLSDTASEITDATPDTTAPSMSPVTVSYVTISSATLSWTTDEPSNSAVRFGPIAGAPDNSRANISSVTAHEMTLTGLLENTTYFFTVSSTDASGNVATSDEGSFTTATSRVDQPPSTPGPIVAPERTNAPAVALSWGASTDDVALASYEVIRDGNLIAVLPPSDTAYSDDVAGEGTHTYEIRATDSAGHTATSDPAIVIVDRTAPQIDSDDVTVEAAGPQTAVSYDVSATDNADATVNVTCSPASGSLFAVGTTAVTCTASDAAGNVGEGTFDVVVEDTTAPAINVPSGVSAEATSTAGAAVTFASSASDLVDGSIATTCTPGSGSTFALGITTVTCSATDAAGNEASRSFDVTVVDTIAPVVTVPAGITAEATSADGAVVTYATSATDIASGNLAPVCSPASGTQFPIGVTGVTCTATDFSGNSTSASFAVAVSDTTAPSIASVAPSQATLWPPDHRMVPLTLNVAVTDAVAASPLCTITGITSNEPQNGLGDGDTGPDWSIGEGLTFQVRAERDGKGAGRVYTIGVRCSDPSGNHSEASTTVSVPKSQAK